MLSLRSLGGFVLIAGGTGLVPSMDLIDDVSDLLLLFFLCCCRCSNNTRSTALKAPLLLPVADEDNVSGNLTAGRKVHMGSAAPGVDDSGRLGRRSSVFLAGTKVEAGGASLTLRVRKWPLNASELVRKCEVFDDDDDDEGRSSGDEAAAAAVVAGGAGGTAVEGLEVAVVDEMRRPVPGVVPW